MLEKETRSYIDKKLQAFGWNVDNHNQVILEYSIASDTTLFADYALLDTDGSVIAIVEAKKYERSARDWQFQALDYAKIIESKQGYRPFVFLSNGRELFFYNSAKEVAPRKIKTFFTLSDLRRMRELQKIQVKPTSIQVDSNIAGRYYQNEAIKKVVEGIEWGNREFLLVMATGTGKTRTAMGIIDVLLKSYHTQRVLFLTDRTALRDQAYDDGFAVYFKSTPKTKIETGKTDENARLFSATYQTMINYLEDFSSGFFDLIIIDEVHRSIYGEWKSIIDHFDCYKVGLTATPLKFVDRSTYKTFGCEDEDPTYSYGLETAIADKFLTPYHVLLARTRFQIQWIKWRQLPKEVLEQLKKEWKDPEDYNFEGTEIGKRIDNKDTNRAVVREFMEQSQKIEDGLPGKTIIFAMNQAHAEHLQETFEEMYPHLNDFSVVITSNVERHDELLKDYKKLKTEKKFRVAISVDMLDTGIDVPEVVNLVFARKIFSEAKFWQMVGRGTRLCPGVFWENGDKEYFLIIDFAMNFDEEHVFKDPVWKTLSLQQKYYEARLEYLKLLENREDKKRYIKEREGVINMVKSLYKNANDEMFERKDLIEMILSERIFDNISINPYDELYRIAPLMRYYDTETIDEVRFALKGCRLKISLLKNEDTDDIQMSMAMDINSLPNSISAVSAKEKRIKEVLSPVFWKEITIESIDDMVNEFRPLMKYRKPIKDTILTIDEPDDVFVRRFIEYAEWKKMASDKYWEAFVSELYQYAHTSLALQKILADQPIGPQDLTQLEQLFKQSEYCITLSTLRRAYGRPTAEFEQLIKVALGKATMPAWETEVTEIFDSYVRENNFSSNQIRFLQIMKAVIIQKKFITYEDFYSDTFEKAFWLGAFERLFRKTEQVKVMEFADRFSLV